jgi:hypothetical protein
MPSMRKCSLSVRIALLLLALVQFSVSGAAAWADAKIGENAGPAHIESHSTDVCVRIHPADCAFHRFLSAPLAASPATIVRLREGHGVRWTPTTRERSRSAADLTLPDSRAPPTLS